MAYLWDKILRVTLKLGEYEILGETVQTPDVVLLSESRVCTLMREVYTQTKYGYWETESYDRFRQVWRSVSQRRLLRETEKYEEKIFHTKQC